MLDTLEKSIHLAATGEAPWLDFVGQLARHTGHGLGLFVHDFPNDHRTKLTGVYNGSPELDQQYLDYYHRINPYLRGGGTARPNAASIGPLRALVDNEEVERSEFYQEFWRPQNVVLEGSVYMTPYRDASGQVTLGLMKRQGQTGMAERDCLRILERLMPHLRTAWSLSSAREALRSQQACSFGVLDQLSRAVVLLDAAGQVQIANRTARALLDQSDGLSLGASGLTAAFERDDRHLARLVRRATRVAPGAALPARGATRVRRPSQRPAYEVLVSPLPAVDRAGPRIPVAAVFISGDEMEHSQVIKTLSELYDLTHAEARVVTHLAEGHTLREVAGHGGVSLETVRSQLKNVFRKTDTRRQSELIRLVLTGVGLVGPPSHGQSAPPGEPS